MAYTQGGQNTGADNGWVETVISEAASWISGLFGNQAEERDLRRFAQNEAAFRAAVAGGAWDGQFLRARTGLHGKISIPVQLPYAVSPSNGRAETPGELGGWATGPAQRHAQRLYDRLQAGDTTPGPNPGSGSTGDDVEALYTTARDRGRDAAEALLQTIAASLYGQIPAEYRAAIEAGVRDHYAQQAGGAATAAVPWIIGAGLLLATLRKR